MKYELKDVSPVEKKITVKAEAEEVNAALSVAVAMFKRQYEVKGFRKGKAPGTVIEQRFRKQIYGQATTDLINTHIHEILGELKITPLSPIQDDAKELERDTDYEYTITFECAPDFEIPALDGLKVEETKAVVDDGKVAEIEKRIQESNAVTKPIEDVRNPIDGDIVSVSFGVYDGDKVVDGIQADNFELVLGQGQSLPDFEDMLKTMTTGDSKEKDVTFPEDFINTNIAGRTLTIKAALHAIKAKQMPEVDDALAKKAGFDNLEAMREAIKASYLNNQAQLNKAEAQKTILDSLLEKVDFPLPPSIVKDRIYRMIEDLRGRVEQQGRSLESLGKTLEQLEADYEEPAKEAVRSEIFLLAVAKQEGVDVSPQDLDMAISQQAMRTQQPFHHLKQYYEENGLLVPLRDRLLCDKAMDLLYDKAEVIEVEPKEGEAKKPAAKKAPAKKAPAKKAAAEKKPAAKKAAAEKKPAAKKAPAKKAAAKKDGK